MKGLVIATVSACLLATSMASFANKIVITGKPIVLEQRGNIYYLPSGYTDTNTGYYYVTAGTTNSVCYLEKNPAITAESSTLTVDVNGKTVTWNCYAYNPEFFEITP
jgi:hypothetical protein